MSAMGERDFESGSDERERDPGLDERDLELGLAAVRHLSAEIGPRPPASEQEAEAASYISQQLEQLGIQTSVESFRSGRSFGPAYMIHFGLACLAGLVRKPYGWLIGMVAGVSALQESRFSSFGLARLTRWRRSRNVFATIEPAGAAVRTVCLMSHMDSSRSGLMFHPRVVPHLGRLVAAAGLAVGIQCLSPLLERWRPGCLLLTGARGMCWATLALIVERELNGEHVAGANDNASGVGACLAIASSIAREPLANTRVVVLVTGSEESGVLGARDFLRRHDTEGWLFLNFDGVSADAPLRVLSKEGGPLDAHAADPELISVAESVGREWSDLQAEPLRYGSGLPYDSTPVLAGGGRGMSIVNQRGPIPDYHWPSDTFGRVSNVTFARAARFGEALLRKLDLD